MCTGNFIKIIPIRRSKATKADSFEIFIALLECITITELESQQVIIVMEERDHSFKPLLRGMIMVVIKED